MVVLVDEPCELAGVPEPGGHILPEIVDVERELPADLHIGGDFPLEVPRRLETEVGRINLQHIDVDPAKILLDRPVVHLSDIVIDRIRIKLIHRRELRVPAGSSGQSDLDILAEGFLQPEVQPRVEVRLHIH